MANLNEYKALNDKKDFFLCNFSIETESQFEEMINVFKQKTSLAFRGVNEAKYKIYSSLQRFIITKDYLKVDYTCLVEKIIEKAKDIEPIRDFFGKNEIPVNDILYLALLQHYANQSPMIDFSYNVNVALFFMLDGLKAETDADGIDEYMSLYVIDYNDPYFCSIQEIEKSGGKRIDSMLVEYTGKNGCNIHDIDTHDVMENMKNLAYRPLSKLESFSVHGEKLGVTDVAVPALGFTCQYNITNPNEKCQEGMFVCNTTKDKPLENVMQEWTKEQKICCYNINKSLASYIEKTYLTANHISSDKIYPDDADSKMIRQQLSGLNLDTIIQE